MPLRSRAVAIRCLSGKRGSNLYTRTLVSTRLGTNVEILPPPPAALGAGSRGLSLAAPLAGGGPVEPVEAVLDGHFPARRARWNDPDHGARELPADLVPRFDSEVPGHRFRDRHLQLARDLGHDLTLVRIHSLLKPGLAGRRDSRRARISALF